MSFRKASSWCPAPARSSRTATCWWSSAGRRTFRKSNRTKPVDEPAGDADRRWNGGQLVRAEPTGVGDFGRIDADLSGRMLCGESHHERIRKRPGLTAEVADVP